MRLQKEKAYYTCVLEHKPGFFVNWVLYTLFKHVKFAPDMAETLREMHRRGTVVYSIKYRGRLDYLLYHYRFRSSRLPFPKIAFSMNIAAFLPISYLLKVLKFKLSFFLKYREFPNPFKTGFFREAIQEGTASLLFLVDPKGFLRHFIHSEKDHIHFLLETQMEMERPIFLVPQLILYKFTPEKDHPNLKDLFFGFKDNPGAIRKIILFFRYNRRAVIDFGQPIDLKAYLERQPGTRSLENMSVEIKQMLIASIDKQKRVILGPVMKTRQQLKEIVLKDKEVIQAIEKKASGIKMTLKEVRKQADKIFNEIAADYNITYIQAFHIVLTWMWKKIYQGIDVDMDGLAVVRERARNGSLVFVPSHKSHIDYLVLNYVLFQHHMHIPRVAAGQNLAFWPMGHIFRKSGAFFIRRTFRGTSLYPIIFSRYIKQLIEEGHPLEFFIEGGRSRSGKLILPKTGFLSILFKAYEEKYSEDLVFIPASISYDRIPEQRAYLKELGGQEKETESLKQVLTARRFLKRKYGKIYIRFGRPISLNAYLDQKDIPVGSAVQTLAFDLTKSINRVTLVTPLALISTAILTKNRKGFQADELFATLSIYVFFLKKYEIPTATSLDNMEQAMEEALSVLVSEKVVDWLEETGEKTPLYYVHEEKKKELEYYKNSIIHFFISHAFVAVSLLSGSEDQKSIEKIMSDYEFLRNLFRNEFVYDDEKGPRVEVEKVAAYFLEIACITKNRDDGGYALTRQGYEELPVWAALAKTFIEAYWVAARTYLHQEKSIPTKSDLLKRMDQQGVQYHKTGFIDHIEGVSQINFENAIRLITEDILRPNGKATENKEDINKQLQSLSQRLYGLSHF